ncbi:MAG: sel1 repeat family protein, partial [Rhodospirillales bacterium]|nr:sel1 repeat family protein [Rhodospirillales bacterium]
MKRLRIRKKRRRLILGAAILLFLVIGGYFLFVPSQEEIAEERLQAQLSARFEAIQPRATAGEAAAQFALAEHFRRGLGVERSPARAMEWYRKAADQSHIGAQLAIGRMFEAGNGVRQDYSRAAQWYELAANIGRSAAAEFALAELFYNGRGVPNDPSEAIKWYGRAASRGHAGAQYILGSIYETGWGVEPDLAEAYKWYSLSNRNRQRALSHGKSYDPESALDKLIAKITRFDMKRGQKMAREWQPAEPALNRLREGTSLVSAPRPAQAAKVDPEPEPRKGLRLLSVEVPVAGEKKDVLAVNVILELRDPALG